MGAPRDPEKYEEWKRKLRESVLNSRPPIVEWTEEEETLLREKFFTYTLSDLCELFPNRTPNSIQNKAKNMGLSKTTLPKKLVQGDSSQTQKRCTLCGEIKDIEAFSFELKRGKYGYRARCKDCRKKQMDEYKARKRGMPAKSYPSEKECHLCGEVKPINQFQRDNLRDDKHNLWCKECLKNYYRDPQTTMINKRYRPIARPPQTPEMKKRYRLMKQYGLTVDQYLTLLEAQGGVCASCGNPETAIDHHTKQVREFLVVDHDHATGKVRALLCNNCNAALGFLQDDPVRIEALLRYARSMKERN